MANNSFIQVPRYQFVLDKKFVQSVMKEAGKEVAAEASSLIRASQGSGRTYKGVKASEPGEIPVNRSGRLAGSLRIRTFGGRGMGGVKITDTRGYARSLEAGAKGGGGNTTEGNLRMVGSKAKGRYGKVLLHARQIVKSTIRRMLPRPFLSVALENKAAGLNVRVGQAISRGISLKEIR
jgi:hypothetical protein